MPIFMRVPSTASNFLFDAILKSSSPTPWTMAYIVAIAISLVTAGYGLAAAKLQSARECGQ